MPVKKKIPQSWTKSDKSIRAVQVIFELEQAQSRALRIKAIEKDLSPSDYIRAIIGLPQKKPVRPRLSISLSTEDYQNLAKRYKLNADDKSKIRECIKSELIKTTEK
ncbi:hypothetical protein MNBD_GAMMA25-503 [hydrothermal vent metagenome]|uniref:Uncharacterized protein n=1 Tax=hydrothermal vent metagenome TaxID=652676 RepID=A0A3B1AQK4_9ZZZZ